MCKLVAYHFSCNNSCSLELVPMACQSEGFDFASLPILDEGVLLEGLRHRYERDSIYVSNELSFSDIIFCHIHYSHMLEIFYWQ